MADAGLSTEFRLGQPREFADRPQGRRIDVHGVSLALRSLNILLSVARKRSYASRWKRDSCEAFGCLPDRSLRLILLCISATVSRVEFDEPTRERIAAAVRSRRSELGLSQEDAARASGGLVSTANLRVVEGAGRSSFRERSLRGVARALGWPDDAIGRIAAGEDPRHFETPSPASPGQRPRATVAGVELATADQIEALQQQIDELRSAVSSLGSPLDRLESEVRRAANDGDADAADTSRPRQTVRPIVTPADDPTV